MSSSTHDGKQNALQTWMDGTTTSLDSHNLEVLVKTLSRKSADPQLSTDKAELQKQFTPTDTMSQVGRCHHPVPAAGIISGGCSK